MKKQLGTLLLLSGLATAGLAHDSGRLIIGGQLRTRTELRNGQGNDLKIMNTTPGLGTSFRSRLTMDYEKSDLKIHFSPQVVATFDGVNIQNQSQLNIFEAYGKYTKDNFNIKIGRQVISHGDQRILGGLDWANFGRTHDGAVANYKKGKVNSYLGVVLQSGSTGTTGAVSGANNNVQTSDIADNTSRGFQYAWLDTDFGKFKFSGIAMNVLSYQENLNSLDAKLSAILTLGGMPSYAVNDNLTLAGSFYYQFGGSAGMGTKTSAHLLSATANYKFSDKLSLLAGADLVSGEGSGPTTVAFNPYYGTHHKFYGFMDFFYTPLGGTDPTDATIGLNDFYLKSTIKIKKVTLLAHAHAFFVNKTQSGTGVESMDLLATELDLVAKLPITKGFGLAAGTSIMTDTKDLRVARGQADELAGSIGNINSWGWLQANFTF